MTRAVIAVRRVQDLAALRSVATTAFGKEIKVRRTGRSADQSVGRAERKADQGADTSHDSVASYADM